MSQRDNDCSPPRWVDVKDIQDAKELASRGTVCGRFDMEWQFWGHSKSATREGVHEQLTEGRRFPHLVSSERHAMKTRKVSGCGSVLAGFLSTERQSWGRHFHMLAEKTQT
ncbi:hypothetical protein GJ744_004720 [Endocarpon pusillum]|uniref:Uncharacterized protein n=1 Tax=Endocarpon pusillum TaxID=364733 RepID=A0A8H7A5M2_9EURO|nr:hypothetical protein GJ744_004720 [Endocarpon pusillum]